jgi:hypothetical protein
VEQARHRNLTAPLDLRQADMPLSVACLVRRLMAKSPEQRVQTPGELAELLEEIQNDPGSSISLPLSFG